MRPAFFSGFTAPPSGAGDISLDFVTGESILQTARSGYHQYAVDGSVAEHGNRSENVRHDPSYATKLVLADFPAKHLETIEAHPTQQLRI